MAADKDEIVERFVLEKIGVDLGNVRETLDQLQEHVLLNGDTRTKVTIEVLSRRIDTIQGEARKVARRYLRDVDNVDRSATKFGLESEQSFEEPGPRTRRP